MIPKLTTKDGKPCWTIDDRRRHGTGKRFYGGSQAEVLDAYKAHVLGLHTITFSDRDKLAKDEATKAGVDLLDAVRFYAAHRPTGKRKRLSDAVTECITDKTRRKRRDYYVHILERELSKFVTYIGGHVYCDEISPELIDRFLHSKDWSSVTINGIRLKLGAFFSWAVERGYCSTDPVKKVEAHTVERTIPKIFTVEDVTRMLDTATVFYPDLLPYLAIGIFCGVRPYELARLAQEKQANGVLAFLRVNREAEPQPGKPPAVIEIPAHISKTRDRRIVEVSSNALAWLAEAGFARIQHSDHRRLLLCKLAHVEWPQDVMRHTFASYHHAKHKSADKTAHELGHRGDTKMLFEHYNATVTPEDAEAFWKIEPPLALKVLEKVA